jgi:hypothetical protein
MKISNEDELLLSITKKYLNGDNNIETSNNLLKVDWIELKKKSLRHKLFPIVYNTIIPFVPKTYQSIYNKQYSSMVLMNNIYIRELKTINMLAIKNNIKIVLLKGLSLSKIIYNNLYLRTFSDIDLLLGEDSIKKMYYLLNDIGYAQDGGYDSKNNKFITLNTTEFRGVEGFHELQCIKIINNKIAIEVELKRASSAIPLNYIGEFLENTQMLDLAGIQILSTNITYTFLHICANFYNDTESLYGALYVTRLRDVLDIALFIKKYKLYINWDDIYKISLQYEITHKIYFVLNNVIDIYDAQLIEKTTIDKFKPVDIPYNYKGNNDGSYFQWKTDILTRMFNDELRKKESIYSFKQIIYNSQYANNIYYVYRDDLNNDDNFKHFWIKNINCYFEYLFTNDNINLYTYILLNKEIYNIDNDYFIELLFIDNGLSEYQNYRIIIPTKKNPDIIFYNINGYNFQCANIYGKLLIKINFPIVSLNMDYFLSKNTINYNILFQKKFSEGMAKVYESLSINDNEPVFLKISEPFCKIPVYYGR